jgi:hypothetical protein
MVIGDIEFSMTDQFDIFQSPLFSGTFQSLAIPATTTNTIFQTFAHQRKQIYRPMIGLYFWKKKFGRLPCIEAWEQKFLNRIEAKKVNRSPWRLKLSGERT